MDVIINRCSRRANLAEELVEEVMLRDHREAMQAHDVEDLVRECMELVAVVERAWGQALDYLFSNAAGDIDALYPVLVRAARRATRTVQRVNRLAQRRVEKGYEIVGAAELAASGPKMERLAAEIETRWPVNDPKVASEALAAYGRGDFQSAEELLRGAQGSGSGND